MLRRLVLLGLLVIGSANCSDKGPLTSSEMRLGLQDKLMPHALDRPVVEVTIDRNGLGVQVERLLISMEDGSQMPAMRLSPLTPGPHPAVLIIHGHQDLPSAHLDAQTGTGLRLAKAGFVVLLPEQRSFVSFLPLDLNHDDYMQQLIDDEDVYLRLATNDMRRAFRALQDSPNVDPDRVGVVGLSLGGLVAWLVAAAEPDVAATEIVGIFVPYETMFDPTKSHECQHLVSLLELGDAIDLTLSILPRALSIQWGEQDPFLRTLKGRAHTDELVQRAAAQGLDGLETHTSTNIGHRYDAARHLDFFSRALDL